MKNSLILILLCFTFCLSTSKTNGQNVTKTIYSENLILDKMAELNELNSADIITENITMKVPLEFMSIEDSLKMEFNEVNLIYNRVRFDPNKMMTVFPEAVNIDEHSNSNIDYTSLIPILWEGIIAQQKQIDLLNSKILELETRLINQIK